jgi:hypothetical protein
MTSPAKDKDTATSTPASPKDKTEDTTTRRGIAEGEPSPESDRFDPRDPDDALVVSNREIQDRGIHYARSGQVRQALGELRNARAHGNETLQWDAEKRLKNLGFDLEAHEQRGSDTSGDKTVDARRQPPEGRSATPPARVQTEVPSTPAEPSGAASAPGAPASGTPPKAAPVSTPAPAATPASGVSGSSGTTQQSGAPAKPSDKGK